MGEKEENFFQMVSLEAQNIAGDLKEVCASIDVAEYEVSGARGKQK